MIKEMLDAKAVGQYAAAVRLSEAWYFIPMVIASSLFPAIINAKKESEKLYYGRLQRLYTFMVWLAIGIALPLTFLSDWLVMLLYGTDYSQAGVVLMIHIWAAIFVFLGVVSGKWYLSENLQILVFWRAFFGMIVNVYLNYILMPVYGVIGAAIATLFGQISAALLFDLFHRQTRSIFWMKIKSFAFIGLFDRG
jgi:O-antigen/teichoic acid export membrane protein